MRYKNMEEDIYKIFINFVSREFDAAIRIINFRYYFDILTFDVFLAKPIYKNQSSQYINSKFYFYFFFKNYVSK